MMAFQKRVALIAGATASGKSALALEVARARRGVIINADAMQVYGALRILTARPSPADESEAPHRLYGHVGAAQSYSAGRWLEEALGEIERAWAGGLLPIVTGGTGLYFRALEHGLADIPAIPSEVRTALRRELAEGGVDKMRKRLGEKDPESHRRLESRDTQRLLRALEVVEATGRTIGDWARDTKRPALLQDVAFERRLVSIPRADLYARAEKRFDAMIAAGAMEEVRAMPGLPSASPLNKAIGLRELQGVITGRTSLDTAVTGAKTATRRYIKRQLTWWRGAGPAWAALTDR